LGIRDPRTGRFAFDPEKREGEIEGEGEMEKD
jgi:hypothetical protein